MFLNSHRCDSFDIKEKLLDGLDAARAACCVLSVLHGWGLTAVFFCGQIKMLSFYQENLTLGNNIFHIMPADSFSECVCM